ncbi:MAG: hypothetical protein RL591_73 [Planctomycetota bacterium]|jgi:hypothetical protein
MILPSLFGAAAAERSRGFGVPLPGCVTSENRLLPVLAVVAAVDVAAGLVVFVAVDAVPVAVALFDGAALPAPAAFAGALTVVEFVEFVEFVGPVEFAEADVVSDLVPDAHAARTAALRPAEAKPSQNREVRAPAVGALAAARSDECAADAETVDACTSAEAARGEIGEWCMGGKRTALVGSTLRNQPSSIYTRPLARDSAADDLD